MAELDLHISVSEDESPLALDTSPSMLHIHLRGVEDMGMRGTTPRRLRMRRRLSEPAPTPGAAEETMPMDLLYYLLSFVPVETPKDLCALERVNRQFHAALRPTAPFGRRCWSELLVRYWRTDALLDEEQEWSLKRVFESRYIETLLPIHVANEELQREHLLDTPTEYAIVQHKYPAQLRYARLAQKLRCVSPVPSPIEGTRRVRFYSDDLDEVLFAVTRFRQQLTDDAAAMDAFADSRYLYRLVEILSLPSIPHLLRFEVIWILTNLCSGSTEHVDAVLDAGALPLLIETLRDTTLAIDDIVVEQAVWALGNIAGDCSRLCAVVLSHEPLPILVHRLFEHTPSFFHLRTSFLQHVAWFMSNLVRSPVSLHRVRKVVLVFATIINNASRFRRDTDLLCDTCWGIAYVLKDASPAVARYITDRIDPLSFYSLLLAPAAPLLPPLLRILSQLAAASPGMRHVLRSTGLPSYLVRCHRVHPRHQAALHALLLSLVDDACSLPLLLASDPHLASLLSTT